MRFPLVARRIIVAPVLGLALALAVSAWSSSSSSSSSSAATPTASTTSTPAGSPSAVPASSSSSGAVAQITANWEKFFNSSTPNSQRVTLLQNGNAFAGAISGLASLVSNLGAKVTGVTLTSATKATVTYDLTSGGSSL